MLFAPSSPRPRQAFGVVTVMLTAALILGAGTQAIAEGDDPVVAKVGAVNVTKSMLEQRLSRVPMIQLATFGSTPAAMRRAFLEKVVIPEILFAQGATAKKVDERPEIRLRLQDALRVQALYALRKEVQESAVTDADVEAYFGENREKFQTPERISVSRILVKTKAEAQAILDEVKKPGGEKKWRDLAREKSTDKATSERGGNLGFIGPDGHSSEVTVKVEPVLFEAAKKVQNGEFGTEPVTESDGFGVVWRRGSTPAVTRTLAQEAASIRGLLVRQRAEAKTKDTIERLRKEHVKDVNDESLSLVDVSSTGAVTVGKKPAEKPKSPPKPQPTKSSEGLR